MFANGFYRVRRYFLVARNRRGKRLPAVPPYVVFTAAMMKEAVVIKQVAFKFLFVHLRYAFTVRRRLDRLFPAAAFCAAMSARDSARAAAAS